jgi:hypothetical protein
LSQRPSRRPLRFGLERDDVDPAGPHPTTPMKGVFMRVMLVALVWTLVVLGLASASYGQGRTGQFGNVVFTIPEGKGWERGYHKGHVSVYNFDVRPSIVMEIHTGEVTSEDPGVWLKKRMNATLDEDERGEFMGEIKPTTYGRYVMAFGGQRVDGNSIRLHVAIRVKDRLEHAFVDTFMGDEPPKNNFQKVFSKFVEDFQFVNDGGKPLIGEPVAGELSGYYLGLVLRYGHNGMEMTNDIFLFSKTGRFYEGVPTGRSPITLDPRKALAEEPDDCGNYEINAGTLTLRYASGRIETKAFKPAGDRLELDEVSYQPIAVPADDTRLDGTFTTSSFVQFTAGSGVTGGAGGGGHYEFFKDGSYKSDRWSGAFGNFDNGAGDTTGGFATSNTKGNERRGKYEVKDGLITFIMPDGTKDRFSLLIVEKGMLLFNERAYLDRSEDGKTK